MSGIYRVMLGRRSVHAAECFQGGFIGTDFDIGQDLTADLPDQWRDFNAKFIPIFLAGHPDKTKIGAGLACGALWTVSKGVQIGDTVLCPDGSGNYRVGEVIGNYTYAPGGTLPHRRKVRWLDRSIPRSSMSEALQNSSGSIGTVCDLSAYAEEVRRLMGLDAPAVIVASDPVIEDPVAFAMEKHLEAFLVANWAQTDLAKDFAIYEEDWRARRPAVRYRRRPNRHSCRQPRPQATARGGTQTGPRQRCGCGADPALHGLYQGAGGRAWAGRRRRDHCLGE